MPILLFKRVLWGMIYKIRTLVFETISKIGKTVLLKGWVNTRRDHGKIVFIDLRDRTGIVQIVAGPELVEDLHSEDVIYVTGMIKARPEKLVNPKLSTGTVEIEAQKVELVSKAAELPFDMGKDELDVELPTLLDYRSLTLRHPRGPGHFPGPGGHHRQLSARLSWPKIFWSFKLPSLLRPLPKAGPKSSASNILNTKPISPKAPSYINRC